MKCDIGKTSIYYETYGEGKSILNVHGFVPDHRLMKGCMEPIFEKRAGYKRIYYDLPGMGKTKGEKWIKNSDQMLEITLKFIEEIIPDEKFLLVGESYGGYLARGVIYKKFDLVEGVCFICPVIDANSIKRDLPKQIILSKNPDLVLKLDPNDAEEFVNIAVIQNQKVWERFRDEFLSGVKVADTEFLDKIWKKGYSFSFDVDKLPEKYEKPALFLMGRQDNVVGYRDAWKIIENYPRATLAILDNAGHILQIEQEILFNSLINEWLDRIENFS